MELNHYPGWEFVSGDHRRGAYWRRIAPNWQNPSSAQAECRRKFGELASKTRGHTGTISLLDGRILSSSAVEISKALSPKSYVEPMENDEVIAIQESAPIIHGRNETYSRGIPVQGTAATCQINKRADAPATQDELFNTLMAHAIIDREKQKAELSARLETEQKLHMDQLKFDSERYRADFEKRMKGTELLMKKLNNLPNKSEDAALSKLKKQIEKIQRKLEDTIPPIPPVSTASQPEIPPAPPADPVTEDFSPSSFLSWTFGAIAVTGLVAWSLKSKENMAAASNIMHAAKAVLNYGKS